MQVSDIKFMSIVSQTTISEINYVPYLTIFHNSIGTNTTISNMECYCVNNWSFQCCDQQNCNSLALAGTQDGIVYCATFDLMTVCISVVQRECRMLLFVWLPSGTQLLDPRMLLHGWLESSPPFSGWSFASSHWPQRGWATIAAESFLSVSIDGSSMLHDSGILWKRILKIYIQ